MADRIQGSFFKIAVFSLRLVAVLLIVDAIIRAVCTLEWDDELVSRVRTMWVGPLGYLLVGVLLWIFSQPIARLVARGLDDSSSGPPAA